MRRIPHTGKGRMEERERQNDVLTTVLRALEAASEPCCSDPGVIRRVNHALNDVRQALDIVHARHLYIQRKCGVSE
jgi:hypothetical protein